MPQFITRCPNCQTSFRTSEEQLSAAAGKVRCGACLNIFLANEHIQPEKAEPHWELIEEKAEQPTQPSLLEDEEDWAAEEPSLGEIRASTLRAELDDDSPQERFSRDNLAALRSIPNPLEIEWLKRSRPGLIRTLLGLGMAALLAVLLGIQPLWFQREALAQDPAWRPRIESLCSVLPCELAPLSDLTAIVTRDLVVRSHPRENDALQITLTFQNDADFPQQFPLLILRFTDEQQRLVAMREFLPEEYLQDGLHLMETMGPGTSIQGALDIVDPGPDAINYEILLAARQDN